MGSGSSKEKLEESASLLRQRRLRDFEEECERPPARGEEEEEDLPPTPPPSPPPYSQQKRQEEPFINLREEWKESELPEEGGDAGGDEAEVEAAIAELEETFKTLPSVSSPPSARERGSGTAGHTRSHSCGPTEPQRPVYTEHAFYHQGKLDSGGGGQRSDVPGRRSNPPPPPSQSSMTRRRGPFVPRSFAPSEGGANSAPAGVNVTRQGSLDNPTLDLQHYEMPSIEGFDILKFKQVNGLGHSQTIRLVQEEGDWRVGAAGPKAPAPSYTKDEMELLSTLERQVY